MNCPNCGLANAPEAKFCANCGTPLAGGAPNPAQPQASYPSQPYQPAPPYGQSVTSASANPMLKNIAVGCLIVVAIFVFMGFSCARACFHPGHRRVYLPRRY